MKSNLKFLIKVWSNSKSNFLANLNINKKVIYPFCFCIKHNSIIQIYFFKEVIDDFDIYWNISVDKYDLKIVYSLYEEKTIWILLWKKIDLWVSWFIWDINIKIKWDNVFWLLKWYINNNENQIIISWYLSWHIYPIKLKNIFTSNYLTNEKDYIELRVFNKGNEYLLNKKYYSSTLFSPDEQSYQMTLLENIDEEVNYFNFRFIEKDVSLVFNKKWSELKYFFIELFWKKYFLFGKDIIQNWNILYKDSLYWYWNVNFYINLQIEKYLLVFSWSLKTIRYPNN